MTITAEQLSKIFGSPSAQYVQWVDPINKTLDKYGISSKQQVAMFLAQAGHESARLTAVKENLNYSADGLANTWPGRYGIKAANGNYIRGTDGRIKPNALALKLHRNQEAIGNNVYADRMGNGNEASGDGFKYRGRGLIQLTGRSNYASLTADLGVDLISSPELLESPLNAALSAGWYWKQNGLNALSGDVEAATRKINGGVNGLADRKDLYTKALSVLV